MWKSATGLISSPMMRSLAEARELAKDIVP